MKQFPRECRDDAARLAANLDFLSKEWITGELIRLNSEIEKRLNSDGVPPSNIIYVALDDPPSSSHAMCKLLRDQGGLSRRKFVSATYSSEINKVTGQLKTGAIVYVDDFAGTGSQFKKARTDVREYIDGIFPEFFLVPCICDEAMGVVKDEDVVAIFGKRHRKSERPLLTESSFLSEEARMRLVNFSDENWRLASLGYGMLASNVIVYLGAPDTTPIIFRGDVGQRPRFGIVPRWAETEQLPNTD